ncbi:hypothetical protein FNV64_02055 [Streptomyces sp. S1A1-7]|uniref:hypothetical protein n=1 Tax=unclassified Streptomyces TaxID=2593676 RepID=UPI00116333FD|nr:MULTISPECIES: hypothetical protein [unclassified Streptomyces]QDN74659.1 hypothetical protein FNV64_02055 [Streptomyces sp. S1A1-7]QDN93348.1 hypothetical protein FNV61_55500 [Streptomyces sp. RLB3-6]
MLREQIASHIPSVFFTVRIDGAWRTKDTGAPGHLRPATLAGHHLRQRAADVLGQHSVLRLDAAQGSVNAALMSWTGPDAGLETTGAVQLTTSPDDHALAEEHLRRQRAIDLDHADERHRLDHLQRVLADPDLRRVWWMAQFPHRHSELSSLATHLGDLSLPHETGGDNIRGDIRRFTDRLLDTLHTPQQREVFLKVLAQTLHTLGHHELHTTATRWQTANEPGSTPT